MATGEQIRSPVFSNGEAAMSVHFDRVRGHWIVRWRDNGRQRARRFDDEGDARAFDAAVRRPEHASAESLQARIETLEAQLRAERGHESVYAYKTAGGPRWRFVFRQSDGSLTTRRGFASRTAAVAARRVAVESVRRGEVKVTRETFGEFWTRLLAERRPYVTAGTLQDSATAGAPNKRADAQEPSTARRKPLACRESQPTTACAEAPTPASRRASSASAPGRGATANPTQGCWPHGGAAP
jgi:hypothetical protein